MQYVLFTKQLISSVMNKGEIDVYSRYKLISDDISEVADSKFIYCVNNQEKIFDLQVQIMSVFGAPVCVTSSNIEDLKKIVRIVEAKLNTINSRDIIWVSADTYGKAANCHMLCRGNIISATVFTHGGKSFNIAVNILPELLDCRQYDIDLIADINNTLNLKYIGSYTVINHVNTLIPLIRAIRKMMIINMVKYIYQDIFDNDSCICLCISGSYSMYNSYTDISDTISKIFRSSQFSFDNIELAAKFNTNVVNGRWIDDEHNLTLDIENGCVGLSKRIEILHKEIGEVLSFKKIGG